MHRTLLCALLVLPALLASLSPVAAKDLLILPTEDFNVRMQEVEDGDVVYLAPGTHSNPSYTLPNVSMTLTRLPGSDAVNLPAPMVYNAEGEDGANITFVGLSFQSKVTFKNSQSNFIASNCIFDELEVVSSSLTMNDSQTIALIVTSNATSLTRVDSGNAYFYDNEGIDVVRLEGFKCHEFITTVEKTAIFDSHLRKSGGGGTINFNGDEVVCLYSKLDADIFNIRGNNLVALFHNTITGPIYFNGPCRFLAGNNVFNLKRIESWHDFRGMPFLYLRNHPHKMELINNDFRGGTQNDYRSWRREHERLFWDVAANYKMERVYVANNRFFDGRGIKNGGDFVSHNMEFVRNSVSGDGNYSDRHNLTVGGLVIKKQGETNPGSSNPYFLNSDGTVSEAGAGGGGPFYFGEAYQPGKTYVITTYLDKTVVIKPFNTEVQADFLIVK